MKAMVLTEFGKPMTVQTVADPTVDRSSVIVEVKANGICRSDWHLWQGDWGWLGLELELPHVLGHEMTGVVVETGADVRRFTVGDRVVVPYATGDGACEYCVSGHTNICADVKFAGSSYWGGYGQYVNVPDADANLVILPDSVDFDTAAALGCRFMTAFHGVVDQVEVRTGEWVAVNGVGGLGLSAVQIASAAGASVIAIDINPSALELATSLGAVHAINSREVDVASAVKDLTRGGAHVAIDALGIEATCLASVDCLRKRGRMLQVGMTSGTEQGKIGLPIDSIVLQELRIVGSAGMPVSRYADMLRMVEQGAVDPSRLISSRVHIEDAFPVIDAMTSFGGSGITIVDSWA